MAMTVTESTVHECRLIMYMTIWLSVGQFLVRVFNANGLFTTFVLAAGITYYSTQWERDQVNPINLQNSAFRATADVIGFLSGIVGFLLLLVASGTKEMVFTPEALLALISAGGLSVNDVFLTMGLTYTSNMSLFSFARFLVNIARVPITLFGGGNNNNAPFAVRPVEVAPAVVPEAPAVAPRPRGRPRGGGRGRR